MKFTECHHLAKGLDPVADAFAGTVYSDGVNLALYRHVTFIVYKGVGATGTSVVTVQAGDAACPVSMTAVPFKYRAITSSDTPGALTAATAAGFTLTAGSSQLYAIEVDAQDLLSAGYQFCVLKLVESVDSEVVGAILIVGSEPRYTPAESTIIS